MKHEITKNKVKLKDSISLDDIRELKKLMKYNKLITIIKI